MSSRHTPKHALQALICPLLLTVGQWVVFQKKTHTPSAVQNNLLTWDVNCEPLSKTMSLRIHADGRRVEQGALPSPLPTGAWSEP